MRTPVEWLSEPWNKSLPFDRFEEDTIPDAPRPTRLQVFAALVSINGSMVVGGWGTITSGGADSGPYGRQGLHQDEAFTLLQLSAMVEGMIIAIGDPVAEQRAADGLGHALQTEWERVEMVRKNKSP